MALEMVYLILVSAIIACIATLAERAIRVWHGQARLIWIVAACAVVGLTVERLCSARDPLRVFRSTLAVSAALPGSSARTLGGQYAVAGNAASGRAPRPTVTVRPARMVPAAVAQTLAVVDKVLTITWPLASAMLFIIGAWSSVRAHSHRRRWIPAEIDGMPVLLSARTGPAVIGLVRRRIVLPQWVMDLTSSERDLVLRHETEHVRACDPALVCAMLLLLIALPWNPVVWVLRRRLQRAIELDCDTRVLSARVNARAYGALLLKVAQLELPNTGIFRVGAAFSRKSDLRARIEYMAKPREASSHGVGMAYVAGSVALVGLACAAPHPEIVVQPRPSVSAPAAQRATMPDANASTMLRSQPGARPEVRAQRQHRAWGGQVSATLGMEEVDTGTTRSGSVAELRRNEAESRRARDSLFEVLHRLTQDRLAMAASVHDSAAALRARAEHELGDSSAIQKALQVTPLGVGIGTLWVLATPQGEVLRMAQSASISAADTITAERVAARLAATASGIRSFSVVNGSRLGLRGVRVVWAVANGRDVR